MATTGSFRHSRNPMYLCMLIFILATIVIIPMEGKRLENCYGEEYRAYKQRVRRWF